MPDGNVAFKVTWVYGQDGPFTSPCTPEGRDINIRRQKKVWCSQPENPCFQIWQQGNHGRINDPYPCYDALIFQKWAFSAGIYHHGKRAGQPIPIRHVQPGKLAFFTSRDHTRPEEDRIIIGCYEIGEIIPDDHDGIMVQAKAGSGFRIKNFQHAPRFWDFYQQDGEPRWGTGLFRYLSDRQAQAMYQALLAAIKKD